MSTKNPFGEYQKQFFELWNKNMSKVPGMEAYKDMLDKMPGMDAYKDMLDKMASMDVYKEMFDKLPGMDSYKAMLDKMPGMDAYKEMFDKLPGMDAYKDMLDKMPDMSNYWKAFTSPIPGMDKYWKSFSGLMPDAASFANVWPYKIPGMDTFAKVFDLWKGMADPEAFAKDYQKKYMDLMQDLFKGILPEGAGEYMQRPIDFMNTCVNYYKANFAPLLKVDEKILKRVAQGDFKAYTDLFREINSKYEETVGKYYNMMGLGVNRESNEDVMKAMSAYNKAMFATAELMSMVMQTGAESMKSFATSFQKAATTGKAPTTFREFYDLWSSVTETELMKLLNTDEFSKTFNYFADMNGQYMTAQNKVYERVLSALPIPTNKDMKSLYKTVYDLRKEVRDLKRELAALKGKK